MQTTALTVVNVCQQGDRQTEDGDSEVGDGEVDDEDVGRGVEVFVSVDDADDTQISRQRHYQHQAVGEGQDDDHIHRLLHPHKRVRCRCPSLPVVMDMTSVDVSLT